MSANNQPDLPQRSPPTERNPETTARFKREAWWQITFPVLVATVISIVLVVLLFVLGQSSDDTSIVADYSLILVIIPNLVFGLIVLVLTIVLIYFIAKLIRGIPPHTYSAQQRVDRVHKWVDEGTDRLAGVLITVRSFSVGINTFLKAQGITPDANAEEPQKQTQPESGSD